MAHLKGNKISTCNRDEAEIIALKSITFLAEDPQRLLRFMSLTGIKFQELSENAGQVSCLIAVLEYLRSDESLLLMFASNHGLSVKAISEAKNILESFSTDGTEE